jgi:hypothetical protein
VVQVWSWFVDFENTTLKPFIHAAYTAPVFGTTSISGSNCPWTPRHAQRYRSGPHVAPPSEEIFSTWYGSGHWLPHAVGPV